MRRRSRRYRKAAVSCSATLGRARELLDLHIRGGPNLWSFAGDDMPRAMPKPNYATDVTLKADRRGAALRIRERLAYPINSKCTLWPLSDPKTNVFTAGIVDRVAHRQRSGSNRFDNE